MSLFMNSGEIPVGALRQLMKYNGDIGCLRPFIGDDGNNYITVNNRGKPQTIVTNTPATLRKDEWILLDQQIIKVAKQRLRGYYIERGSHESFGLAIERIEFRSGRIAGDVAQVEYAAYATILDGDVRTARLDRIDGRWIVREEDLD